MLPGPQCETVGIGKGGRREEEGTQKCLQHSPLHAPSSAIIYSYCLKVLCSFHAAITIHQHLRASLPRNSTDTRGRAPTQHWQMLRWHTFPTPHGVTMPGCQDGHRKLSSQQRGPLVPPFYRQSTAKLSSNVRGPDQYSFSLTQQDLHFNGVSFYPSLLLQSVWALLVRAKIKKQAFKKTLSVQLLVALKHVSV